jgi:hypothetical protein
MTLHRRQPVDQWPGMKNKILKAVVGTQCWAASGGAGLAHLPLVLPFLMNQLGHISNLFRNRSPFIFRQRQ